MKCATQSQLKCTPTAIVFKAGANKRHFSQCSDLLIMNSKLPSLLFIKWLVTADELLVLKVNGICHRASKRENMYKISGRNRRGRLTQAWGNNREKRKCTKAQKAFYLIKPDSF